jgi:hypothetical protein
MLKRGIAIAALLRRRGAAAPRKSSHLTGRRSPAASDHAHRPGQELSGVWLYKRRDPPIRVVKTYPNCA